MTARKLILAFFGLWLVFIFPSALSRAQEAKPIYESLLERVKKSDPKVDFAAFRYAYADNPPKDGGTDFAAIDAMSKALGSKNYKQALEYAERVLKGNYTHINAHVVAAIAYGATKDAEKEKFHRYVADGLLQSILTSGDGKTHKTAWTVISTGEEYVVLRAFGLMPGLQSLQSMDGHHYDRLEATDPKTKEKVVMYFNIDRPYGELQKIFKN